MHIHSVLLACELDNKSFTIPLSVTSENTDKIIETKVLLDTGAGGKFIDQNYARKLGLKTHKLRKPIIVKNVNGSLNKRGTVSKYTQVTLNINGRNKTHQLLITGLGQNKIILGLPWFEEENPDIDWEDKTLK